MDLRQMEYFVTVVQHRNFSKAAAALHISQPSLSKAIRNMEAELGTRLLERTTRDFRLTDAGTLLFNRALPVLRQMDVIMKEMGESISGSRTEILVGVIESAHKWFTEVMAAHKEVYPHNTFTVVDTLYDKTVMEALLQYDVHAVVTNQEIKNDQIEAIPLYEESFLAVYLQGHEIGRLETVRLEDICRFPLVLGMPSFKTRQQIMDAFKDAGQTPKVEYQIERFEMVKKVVENGLGVALLPEKYVSGNLPEELAGRKVDDPRLTRTVYFCFVKARYFPAPVKSFFERIVDKFE
ncbi:LysR family transcriptional regulator [Edaphobacillus lindanitolerans]|uniref:DNA-binding transcriptional regulator, LysR family n=1 Tax=Edaphobacillus lindanitolerans TaxID=550447 RepID=A0A1U7PL01_9BACI|nr:LysR family transcriptional regulator [Edaphobacillus lindanitolerans]SIT75388.1 DNA-binding transcriptional regulator, LysR family [Edaphobacillus lindanitolerans]